jgi:hypothetical protein
MKCSVVFSKSVVMITLNQGESTVVIEIPIKKQNQPG